jgi:uncharacterized damage-inducible protein DinB
MTYYGAKELAESFKTVRKNTIQVAEDIPEDKYGYKAAPDVRSVGDMLTHIALSPSFQLEIQGKKLTTLEGFNFQALMEKMGAEAAKPRTKVQVLELLRSEGDKFAGFLSGLSDDFLGQTVSMPPGGTPPQRTRFDMIMAVKEHEMHHRGQLMLIERILGIVPHLTKQQQERMARMQQQQQQQR